MAVICQSKRFNPKIYMQLTFQYAFMDTRLSDDAGSSQVTNPNLESESLLWEAPKTANAWSFQTVDE